MDAAVESDVSEQTARLWAAPKVRSLRQRGRLGCAAAYVLVVLVIATLAGGVPSLDAEGSWFWSGVLLVLLGSALTEPFFPTPGDAVANGCALILGAVAYSGANPATLDLRAGDLRAGRNIVAGYGALVVVLALAAILTKPERPDSPRQARSLVVFMNKCVRALGSARTVYSVAVLSSSLAAFHDDVATLAVVWAGWFVVAVMHPLEWLAMNAPRPQGSPPPAYSATVIGLRNPNLVELQSGHRKGLCLGSELDTPTCRIEIIDRAAVGTGVWALAAVDGGLLPAVGASATPTGGERSPAIGYVEDGTTLAVLRFALASGQSGLAYGDLVQARVGDHDVLYQVVDAKVRTTSIDRDSARSHVLVDAARLGSWDAELRRFVPAQWLPHGGTPVRALPASPEPVSAEAIGHVPGTSFAVQADIATLITHSTAVLGVLGSGKSTLARELMMRAIRDGRKILVLDTTPEHAEELAEFLDVDPNRVAEAVNAETAATANKAMQNQEAGGNREAFRDAIRDDLRIFLDGDCAVRVYDLTKFEVTRQASWKDRNTNSAEFTGCTLPELTALAVESAFEVLRTFGFADARLWVALEEGHHLIPEFNSVAVKDDEKAVQRTTKVFLQGRKFGLGALLVTQRTANVSKSLLTQCNTIFCFRAHDDTTSGFLKDRAGAAHVAALPNLPDRRVLAFGRGLGAEDPLFLRVNDPEIIRAKLFPTGEVEVAALFPAGQFTIANPDAEEDEQEWDEAENTSTDQHGVLLCWCEEESSPHAPHGTVEAERWGWEPDGR